MNRQLVLYMSAAAMMFLSIQPALGQTQSEIDIAVQNGQQNTRLLNVITMVTQACVIDVAATFYECAEFVKSMNTHLNALMNDAGPEMKQIMGFDIAAIQ